MKTACEKLGQLAMGTVVWTAAMTTAVLGQDAGSPVPTVAAIKARLNALQTNVAEGTDRSYALAAQVAKEYAAASDAGKVDWDKWMPLVTVLGGYIPAPTQATMNTSLTQWMQQDIAKAPYAKLKAGWECLISLGNRGGANELARQWVTGSQACRQLSVGELAELAGMLPPSDDLTAGRRTGEAILEKLLGDPQAPGALDLPRWSRAATSLAPTLTPAQRAQWAGKLQQAWAEKDLAWDDLQRAIVVMDNLGQGDKSGLVAAWMARDASCWKTMGPDGLLQLVGWLGGASEAAVGARGKIAASIGETLTTAPQTLVTRSVEFSGLIQGLGPNLSDEQKLQWRSRLREAAKVRPVMNARDVQDAIDWLRTLGEANEEAFVAEWTLAQKAWQAWKARELPWLVGRLNGTTPPSRAARVKIAAHVLETMICQPEPLAAMPIATLGGAVQMASADWTQAQRGQCLAAIRASFATKPMTVTDLQALEAAFRPLGDAAFVAFVAEWINAQTCWQESSPADLAAMYLVLGNTEPARPARAKVAAQLAATVLGSPKTLGAMSVGSLCQLARTTAPEATPAIKQQWAGALRAAFAQTRMDNTELAAVRETLQSLGDAKFEDFIPGWIAANQAAWQDWSPSNLAGLARQGSPAEEMKPARAKIAAHVAATTISQPQVLAAIPPDVLGDLVRTVGPDWSSAQRAQCIQAVREAFGGKPTSLPALQAYEGVLRPLGDEVFAEFVSEWINAQPGWQQFSLADLNALYGLLRTCEAGKAARGKIVARLTAVTLDGAQVFQASSVAALCQTARSISPDFTPALRDQWVAGIRVAGSSVPLTNVELVAVREALQVIGDAKWDEFPSAWVAAQAGWKNWPLHDLPSLMETVGAKFPVARRAVAAHVLSVLAQPGTLAQAPSNVLVNVVQGTSPEWTDAQRGQCLAALRAEFCAKPMSLQALRGMEGAVQPLGAGVFPMFVGDWVAGQSAWQQFSLGDLNDLYGILKASEVVKPARAKVVAQISATTLGNSQSLQPAGLAGLCETARGMAPDLTGEVRGQWTAALRATATKSPLNNTQLASMRETLQMLGDPKFEEFIPDWIGAQASWKDWSAGELSGLMKALGPAGPAKTARAAVAAHVLATLARPGSVAGIPAPALTDLLQTAMPEWSEAQRAQCLAAMKAEFAAKPMSLLALQATEPLFRPLGEGVFLGFVGDWLNGQSAWREYSLSDLDTLYGLVKASESAKPVRAKIVAQITATTLGNAQSVQPGGLAALSLTARAMVQDLTPAVREQWTTALRAIAGKSPMSNAELAGVRESLQALGDPKFEEFIPGWVAAQASWKDWPAGEVSSLLKTLGPAGPGKAARTVVAAHILAALAKPGAIAGMPTATFTDLVQTAMADWSEAQRAQCLAAMRAEFAAKPMALQALQATEPLFRPLGEGVFVAFVGDWLNGQSGWRQYSLADLSALYDLLKASPGAKPARETVVAQITTTTLGNAQSVGPEGLAGLCLAARGMAPDLTVAAREQWTTTLRTIAARTPLSNTDLAGMREALQALGDAKFDEFIPAWVAAQTAWKDWPAGELSSLMKVLGPAGAGKTARTALAAQVLANFAKPGAIAAIPPAALTDLLSTTVAEWTDAQRTQCLAAMRAEFAAKPMSLQTLQATEGLFRPLGDGAFLAFVGDWLNGQSAWKEFPLVDLRALHDMLKVSEALKPARAKVVAQISATMLADAQSVQPAGMGALCQSARELAPDLAGPAREQWAGALRAVAAKSPLGNVELATVRESLQALGDPKFEEFIPAWVGSQTSWKEWSAAELSSLMKVLGPAGPAKPARAALASHVLATFAQPGVIAATPVADLTNLLQTTVADWTEAQRNQCLATLRAEFAPKPMPLQTLLALEPVFRPLGEGVFLSFVGDWLNGQSAWKQFSLTDLNALYNLVKSSEALKPAKERVVAQITATTLGNAQSLQPAGLGALGLRAREMAPDLTGPVREQWVTALRTAGARAPLNNAELAALQDALVAMGDAKSEEFIPGWVAAQNCWKDWPAEELSKLVKAMPSPAGLASRRAVAAHVVATLAQADILTAIHPNTLNDLAQTMLADWTDAQRGQWRNAMHATFGVKAMSLEALRAMESAFRPLGDLAYVAFLDVWVNSQACWQQFSLGDLNWLYGQLRTSESAKQSRAKLVAQMTTTILGNAQALQTTSMASLAQTVRSMLPDTTATVREQWTVALRSTFGKMPVTGSDLNGLREALQTLGDTRFEEFISDWINSQSCWHSWLPNDLANLARLTGTTPKTKSAREIIAAQATAKFMSNDAPASGGDWDAWRSLAVALGDELSADQRARWAEKLRSLHQRD